MPDSHCESVTLVTGGTGFVGQELLRQIECPLICSRSKQSAAKRTGLSEDQILSWSTNGPLPQVDQRIEAVVNLMGESIAEGRWTDAKKRRIRESRVDGTRHLVDGLIAQGNLPKVFVSASAIGFYGDQGETVLDENGSPGQGFLTDVCREWEDEAMRLEEHGVRVVCLRMCIVIGKEGGAIKKMAPIFRGGVGGRLGNGKQWMAWIHVEDLCRLIMFCIDNESISGPVNATSVLPVRNAEFTRAMAKAVNRPAIVPVPKFLLRIALGEFANSLFFSQRVIPQAALDAGFEFKFPDVVSAIDDVI